MPHYEFTPPQIQDTGNHLLLALELTETRDRDYVFTSGQEVLKVPQCIVMRRVPCDIFALSPVVGLHHGFTCSGAVFAGVTQKEKTGRPRQESPIG